MSKTERENFKWSSIDTNKRNHPVGVKNKLETGDKWNVRLNKWEANVKNAID